MSTVLEIGAAAPTRTARSTTGLQIGRPRNALAQSREIMWRASPVAASCYLPELLRVSSSQANGESHAWAGHVHALQSDWRRRSRDDRSGVHYGLLLLTFARVAQQLMSQQPSSMLASPTTDGDHAQSCAPLPCHRICGSRQGLSGGYRPLSRMAGCPKLAWHGVMLLRLGSDEHKRSSTV